MASNVALVLAKHVGTSPRGLAKQVVQHLPLSPLIERTEIAGPGFINFFLAPEAWVRLIQEIRATGDRYGTQQYQYR